MSRVLLKAEWVDILTDRLVFAIQHDDAVAFAPLVRKLTKQWGVNREELTDILEEKGVRSEVFDAIAESELIAPH